MLRCLCLLVIWHPFINPWTIYGPCPAYWTMDETIYAVARIFSSLPFGVPKQQISPILIDLVLCGLPSMENSEYLSLQIEKIRVEHQPPTITLQSASSSSFDMGTGRRPWSLSSLFLGPPFFVEKKVFRWMWSSFLRRSTYNKGFQKGLICTTQRFFYPLFWGSRLAGLPFCDLPSAAMSSNPNNGSWRTGMKDGYKKLENGYPVTISRSTSHQGLQAENTVN